MKKSVKIENDPALDLDVSMIEDPNLKFRRLVSRLISASSQIAVHTRYGPAQYIFLEKEAVNILTSSNSEAFCTSPILTRSKVLGVLAGMNVIEKNDNDSTVKVSRNDTTMLYNSKTEKTELIDQEQETYLTFKLKI